ncbi:MAG: c-type cytochrome [Chitinophagaceae bacterium]
MKKTGITIFALVALLACNNDPKTNEANDSSKPAAAAEGPSSNPDYAPGLKLVAESDCFQCHKVDEGITGPSYRAVANKFASQAPGIIPVLAGKIINGSTGEWGTAVMLPHPSLSEADAETMVKYILTLKNN